MVTANRYGQAARRRSVERARLSQLSQQKACRPSYAKSDRPSRHDDDVFVPLAPMTVAPYLEAYGYSAASAAQWKVHLDGDRAKSAHLDIGIISHLEIEGHTWYTIECQLSMPRGADLKWKAYRRLQQLREHLHAHIKLELKEAYDQHFAEARFAHYGGLPGTTGRLHNWCKALAACVNSGKSTPNVVALVLHFLEAPSPELARFETDTRASAAPAPAPSSDNICDNDTLVWLDIDDFQGPPRIETASTKPITSRLPPPPPSFEDGPVARTLSRSAEDD